MKIELPRKDLMVLIKQVQSVVTIDYCPSHIDTIMTWLSQHGYELKELEKLGSSKGYIVHYDVKPAFEFDGYVFPTMTKPLSLKML